MPAPATAAELLGLIQRSGVAEEPKLRAYVEKLRATSALPTDPAALAGLLVRDGILTYFQAEQLLQGKYKRFTIGKYKVLEKLGAGGMAQVFLCEHKLMRRRVAIKVLPTAKADDQASLDRFYREARAVAAVDHPNIVRAYDIDQDENLHFLVMEYVDGTNLQELVKKIGPLDVTRACHYVYGASVGLQHAHEIGLIHRDIKPGNLLVDRSGVVKVLDLGLARITHDQDDNLTRQNDENVLGTADYLAPEQALDSHAVDIRADIYSLGATFYYLLTGSAPFPEGSVAQKLIWHQNRQPRPIQSLRRGVPDEIVAIVEKMMAKKPADRYQTPAEVMAALASWVATPIPPPSEREMPQLSLAAGGTGGAPGSGRGPATMIAPVFASTTTPAPPGGFPATDGASPPTRGGGSTLSTTPAPGAPGPPVWESLDDDTQTVARGDTDRARPKPDSRPRRDGDAPASPNRLLYALVPLVVLAAAVGVYFAFFHKSAPPSPSPPPPNGPRKIIVSKAAGEHHVTTLREALSQATPGDTIVVTEPKLVESTLRLNRTKHKDVTIEGATADGKPPVIEASGALAMMIDVASVEGFRLKNLEFDGLDKAEVGIQVSGPSAGVVIENVSVRRAKSSGVKLSNATGGEGRVLLDRLRVQVTTATQNAILLAAANADTHRVTVSRSRLEGPVGAPAGVGVRIDGPTSDVEIADNRFFNLDAALSFDKVPEGKTVKGHVTSNTVYGARAGLLFDLSQPPPPAPPDPLGRFALTVDLNYFAMTPEIGKSTGAPPAGVASANNAFGPGCTTGNAPLTLVPLDTPQLPAPDPNNDASFLRFPGGPPKLPTGQAVGAR